VQRTPQIPRSHRRVDLFGVRRRQHVHNSFHVGTADRIDQLLSQRHRVVGRRQELFAFVLRPYPPFFLLSARRGSRFRSALRPTLPHGVGDSVADRQHHAQMAGTGKQKSVRSRRHKDVETTHGHSSKSNDLTLEM
jgi:hypothetical protein